MVVLSGKRLFASFFPESIIELTVYALDGLIYGCVLPNMDLCVCDFAICDI